ncbi:MAG: lysophospholipid acyltransferase family protein [bacterium]
MKEKVERFVFGQAARYIAPPVLKLIRSSSSLEVEGEKWPAGLRDNNQNFLLAFWHGQMIPLLYYFGPAGFYTFISPHRDGEYIARVLEGMGHYSLRTSLRDLKLKALVKALRLARDGETLVITPDGPIGPCHRVKEGVIRLSERAGLPVLPSAGLARPSRIFSSWDRFCLPYPFSRLKIKFSRPIDFSEMNCSSEEKRQLLQAEMERLTGSVARDLDINPELPPGKISRGISK